MRKLTARIAATGGATWVSSRAVAVWPWPATVIGMPRTLFTWDDYRAFTKVLKPGDLLLGTSLIYKKSNRRIPGAFKHLGVYTGAVHATRDQRTKHLRKARFLGLGHTHTGRPQPGDKERTVVHSTRDGVIMEDLGEFLFHYDYVIALAPCWEKKQRLDMVQCALNHVGQEYNFDFSDDGPPALYCTELGVRCLTAAGILSLPEKQRIAASLSGILLPFDRFKKEVYLADWFVSTYEPVCTSVSCNDPEFPKASPIRDIIRIACLNTPDATRLEKYV